MQKPVKVIATLATLLVVVTGISCSSKCQLVKEDPLSSDDRPAAALLAPSDKSALVSFLADLTYRNTTGKSFMPLTATKISIVRDDYWGEKTMTVTTDCATMYLGFVYNDGFNELRYVNVDLAEPNNGIKSCEIVGTGILWGTGQFYSCQTGRYDCIGMNAQRIHEVVATINIGDLKIELDRLPNADDDRFSRDESHC